MCGIVGYVGTKPAQGILMEGLRRLEHRGYDSAGIAIWDPRCGEIRIEKRAGKLQVLQSHLPEHGIAGTCGIAHTRWSTHGGTTDENAHPHASEDGSVAIVHNGTIENYRELRSGLEASGVRFRSETDSEILAHLIARTPPEYREPMKAVRKALASVRGSYGLAVLFKHDPDRIVIARRGSSMVFGVIEGGIIAASDPAAILQYTKDVICLNDGEIAELTMAGYDVRTSDLTPAESSVMRIEWPADRVEKDGHPHFMLKEILEQPRVIEDGLSGRCDEQNGLAVLGGLDGVRERLKDAKRLVIVACGSAWHAGLVGEYMLERNARLSVEVELASEFRYREPVLDRSTAVLAISQSGETADTYEAMREAKRHGCLTLGIVNVPGSSIDRETDAGIHCRAGVEKGVASTKVFLSQLATLALFTVYMGRTRGMTLMKGQEILAELKRLPDLIRETLERRETFRMRVAERMKSARNALFIGRGYSYPVALEGALKLKEIAYVNAQGYAAGEMKHGTIALIDEEFPTIVIAPKDLVLPKTVTNVSELSARNGPSYVVTMDGTERLIPDGDTVVRVPETLPMLTPILTTIPLQFLAYEVSVAKGHDPDFPRNLAKSVTVE